MAEFPADPTMEGFAKEWDLMAERLGQTKQIQPRPVDVRGGGLVRVLQGFPEIHTCGPRGKKIVYSQE